MPRSLTAALVGAAALWSAPALAQDQDQAGPSAPVEAITVTATRLPQPLAATPDAYVITGAEIDRRQAALVTDVLTEVPGVSLSQDGAFGGVASVMLRGAASDKTLVLIDGVPVNDPTAPAGGYDFSTLDAAEVQTVEVLTGPQGALWGSDAIGGVIAITTREPDGLAAFAEGGSLATLREGASLGQAAGAYAIGASLSNLRTAGVPDADEKFGGTKPDGFNDTTFTANGRVSLSPAVTLDARVLFNQTGQEFDSDGGPTGVEDGNNTADGKQGSGYVRLQVKDLFGFDQELRADLMDLYRQYFGDYGYSAQGDQQVYRWAATRQTTPYGLAFGFEHRSASENTGYGLSREQGNGEYAIARLNPWAALTLTASLRRDGPEHYRGQTTARTAANYAVGGGFSLRGSFGQGFKAPSIYETAYPCYECLVQGPDRSLRPERAQGWDAGAAWRSPGGAVQLQATWFDLRVRDEIDYIYPEGYLNIDSVHSQGVEAAAQAQLPLGWSLRAAYTHDDAVDGTGARLLRVPRDSGSGSAGWRGFGWTADVGLRSQGDAPDVYGTIRPYTVVYATAAYALTRSLTLTARVENLDNSHYEEAYGYGEPGRMVLVGLRWRSRP